MKSSLSTVSPSGDISENSSHLQRNASWGIFSFFAFMSEEKISTVNREEAKEAYEIEEVIKNKEIDTFKTYLNSPLKKFKSHHLFAMALKAAFTEGAMACIQEDHFNLFDKYPNDEDATPLILAVKNNNVEIVKSLLERQQNYSANEERILNETDNKGNSPLHYAILYNYVSIVRVLYTKICEISLPYLQHPVLSSIRLLLETSGHPSLQTSFFSMINLSSDPLREVAFILEELEKQALGFPLANSLSREGLSLLQLALCLKVFSSPLINKMNKEGVTPLQLALHHKFSVITTLLTTSFHRSQLCLQAALNGDKETVLFLLDCPGINIHFTVQKEDPTLLHIAAAKGWQDVVKMLLKKEASLEVKACLIVLEGKSISLTPLGWAFQNRQKKIVSMLAEAGAQLNLAHLMELRGSMKRALSFLRDCGVPNSLIWQSAIEENNTQCLDYALSQMDRFFLQELEYSPFEDNRTALHTAIINKHKVLVEWLLKCGVESDARMANGVTPLHLAIQYGNLEVVELLIAYQANPMVQTDEGLSLLHYAVEKEDKEAVNVLIDKFPSLTQLASSPERGRVLPIHRAVEKNNFEITQLLLQKKQLLQLRAKAYETWTPFEISVNNCGLEIAVYLFNLRPCSVNSLNAENRLVQKLFWLIMQCLQKTLHFSKIPPSWLAALVNVKSLSGDSLLHFILKCPLSFQHHEEALRLLDSFINCGADLTLTDSQGHTALEIAVKLAAEENLPLFLLKLIKSYLTKHYPEHQETGVTMLHCLVVEEGVANSRAYLESPISHHDLNSQTTFTRQTPLHWAVKSNQIEQVLLLIEKGCDVNMKDKNGSTALDYAVNNNNIDCCEILLQEGAYITDYSYQKSQGIADNKIKYLFQEYTNNVDSIILMLPKWAERVNRSRVRKNIKNSEYGDDLSREVNHYTYTYSQNHLMANCLQKTENYFTNFLI